MLLLSGGESRATDCVLVSVEYSESLDVGHGGMVRTCRITKRVSGYDVTASRGRPYPRPGRTPPASTRSSEHLKKPAEDVRRFLASLVFTLRIHELPEAKSPIGLHPTFVTFRLQDSCGANQKIESVFEGYRPDEPRLAAVVNAFRDFMKDSPP